MAQYTPHVGNFYADIGDGTENKIDFCMVCNNLCKSTVVILKYKKEFAVYDLKELSKNKKNAKVLYGKRFETEDECYKKMIYVCGKMLKKSITKDKKYTSRYFTNSTKKEYEKPNFVSQQHLMEKVYKIMKQVEVFWY